MTKLRDFIHQIRDAKTYQEEREIIAKEAAEIRDTSSNPKKRAQNIAKLMYMHMLGYNTKFAQMDSIQLISSEHYAEKRLGYLALMILLDETQEVLPLIEHSLKKDLDDKNQFVQSLALTAIANIASHEICRDLCPEVQKLLGHSPYVRKKAALCAVRSIQKCPDLAELFLDDIQSLLKEHNHAVLLTTVTLMLEILNADTVLRSASHDDPPQVPFKKTLIKYLPQLLNIFKGLLMSSFTKEHDIHGIADPFLQIKLLQLFRALGHGDLTASEAMNDLLAQAATNTESGKTAANAILYECVNTIMGIESEKGLRVLGVYQLSEFLTARDNNLRYVSLNTLKKVLAKDQQSVLRHLSTIIECLKDHDISIRKRAVDLLLQLVSRKNIKLLMQEFIEYLQRATDEEKQDLTSNLSLIIEEYAPSIDWKVDTYMRVLLSASHYVPLHMANKFIALLTHCNDEMQRDVTTKLYTALLELCSTPHLLSKRSKFLQVAVWTVGEFSLKSAQVDPSQLLKVLRQILDRSDTDVRTKAYVITALTKLSERIPPLAADTQQILHALKSNPELELQLRSCEYSALLNVGADVRRKVVAVPHPPIEIQEDAHLPFSEKPHSRKTSTAAMEGSLIEFDDIGKESVDEEDSGTTATAQQHGSAQSSSSGDILMFFDDLENNKVEPHNSAVPSTGLDDFFSDVSPQNANNHPQSSPNRIFTIYEKEHLVIELELFKPDEVYSPEKTTAIVHFSNSNLFPLTSFTFQVKLPKYLTMKLYKATSDRIPGASNRKVQQKIELTNMKHGEKPLVLKYQIKYKQNEDGEFVVQQGTTQKLDF
uniref:AP-1 complex subunit gamma n=1 Tax=Percolomonas cosmopolitus TaxID=63605 RepID=A0A7S1PF79_9EUKA|eukprot:CAMPEP_0117438442 /NCGR_PEP_ID=MMETSP0759-20121206/2055_1 /TAXON_ID=63605 /ORGANISM="Percolomonas cosmopolitus, Strain WS" /LENGTH=822 /DNA_ID=CAMNT_0005230133 /DNA_START=93 /DNA_END=2561 /DNA_ORIENTATION=+